MTSVATPQGMDGAGLVIARKYRLDRLLGEGGMGSIWQALNLQLESPVAVKLLRTDLDAADLGERLRVEARAVAKLVHPSIVRVFDIGETEWGDPFIVMELLEGESLSALLQQGPLSAADAIRLLLPIAEALTLAHSRGVVHRDIKPDNIFLAREGAVVQPKLLDFGIAKVLSSGADGTRAVTQTGTLLGSPDYMSPEQAYGRSDIDERTDVWSFCVVLYEALTGRTPFAGDSCSSLLHSVVRDEPRPFAEFVEPELARLIAAGMMKQREQRPSSMFELGRALASFLVSRGILQDVTGASLEAKWLERAVPAPSVAAAPVSNTPASIGEQATLRSVTRPRAFSSSEPILLEPRPRGHLRALSTAVVFTALVSGAAWASWERSSSRAAAVRVSAWSDSPPAADAPALSPQPAAPAAVISVDALPILSNAPAPAPTIARKPRPAPAPTALRVAPVPNAPSLPRALPAHSSKGDLLNPY